MSKRKKQRSTDLAPTGETSMSHPPDGQGYGPGEDPRYNLEVQISDPAAWLRGEQPAFTTSNPEINRKLGEEREAIRRVFVTMEDRVAGRQRTTQDVIDLSDMLIVALRHSPETRDRLKAFRDQYAVTNGQDYALLAVTLEQLRRISEQPDA